jgi:NAD(P) transhydrogenase
VGGAGVNTGTIPSKTLRETALYFSGLAQRGLYGVDMPPLSDFTVRDFLYREQEVVRSLREVVHANIERHQIELIHGTAAFADPHTIAVTPSHGGAARTIVGDVILIATGSVPSPGRDLPANDPRVYDSDSILGVTALPRTLGVVGAGVIGCEYASMFAALGIRVLMVDGRSRLLPFLDGETADRLRVQLELLGVDVRTGEVISRFTPGPEGIALELRSGDSFTVDAVLVAAGRLANTAGLDLAAAGLAADERGYLVVNEYYQTAQPHIYAAGDVIGFPSLAAISMEQARVAMCHAFDLKYKTRVAAIFPLAVYTIPEVAMAGETEESCRDKGIDYEVGRALYRQNARGQIVGDLAGQVKLVFRAADRALLGVHIIGDDAAELVHVGLMVMQAGGAIDAFINAVFNYPTLGEAYKYAAYDGLGALARRGSASRAGGEASV